MSYELTINGRVTQVEAPPLTPLVRVLREEVGLTGTKEGCAEGRCGSCTVVLNGDTVTSCLYPIALAEGAEVRTIEGLAQANGSLSRLQQAILQAGGVQCGFCTPGILMTLTDLHEENPAPTEEDVRESLSGNICRCTGYAQIVEAMMAAAQNGGGE